MLFTCFSCNNESSNQGSSSESTQNTNPSDNNSNNNNDDTKKSSANSKITKIDPAEFVKDYNKNLLTFDKKADKLGEFKKSSYALLPSECFSHILANQDTVEGINEYTFYEAKVKNQPISIYILIYNNSEIKSKDIIFAINSSKAGNPTKASFQLDKLPYYKAMLKTLYKSFTKSDVTNEAKLYAYNKIKITANNTIGNYTIDYQDSFQYTEIGIDCTVEYLFDEYTGVVTGLFLFSDN